MRLPIHTLAFLLVLCRVASSVAQPADGRFRIIRGVDFDAVGREVFSITELSSSVFIEEIGGETRGQVDRLDQFLATEQWPESIDMLIRLTEYQGNKLVAAKGLAEEKYARFVSVGDYVNERLSTLSGPARQVLKGYRERVDPLAEQWYEQAISSRNEALLQRIRDEALNSSVGQDALMVLGEVTLENGNFDKARDCWRSIHPNLNWLTNEKRLPVWQRLLRGEPVSSVSQDILKTAETDPAAPDSQIPIEGAWARLTLVSILEGNRARAAAELAVLRHCWADASGIIGGQHTNFAEFLTSLLEASRSWPKEGGATDWQTFAGNSTRNHVGSQAIDIAAEPAWQIPLEPIPATNPQAARKHNVPIEKAGESSDYPSSNFPIVVGDLVLLHDKFRIRGLDLNTGKPAWRGSEDGTFYANAPADNQAQVRFGPFGAQQAMRLGEQRFTLSSNGNLLAATIGSHQGLGGTGNPALVGFDPGSEGALLFGPVEVEDARWTFHGAPVCGAERCWVGLRLRDVSAQDHVACFDIRSGKQLWRTRICSADTIGHNHVDEFANYLLTMHEGTIYFHSHLGCVAALNADDGKIRWLTKYPRQGPRRKNLVDEPWHALRDLTPCLYFEGMLIVAPSDSPKIFALDASHGHLIWETEFAKDATQLLGVGEDGNLIVSGRRLWWLDVYTGQPSKKVSVNPFPAGAFSSPVGVGRGLLTGGNIYWPTQDDDLGKIFVLSQADGTPTRQPIDLEVGDARAGNLIVTGTHLLIAAPDRLTAYRLIGR